MGCLEITVRYDSMWKANNSVKDIIHLDLRPLASAYQAYR